MKHGRFGGYIAILLVCGLALWGCSDGGGERSARAAILDQSIASIAADALSDTPSAEYLSARTRVNGRLSAADRERARRISLSPGTGNAVVIDSDIQRARRAAAAALGTSLDPARESDVKSAEDALAALRAEVQRINAAALTCDALPGPKGDDCALALIIIEVRRSEAPRGTPDAGTPDADGGLPDAGPVAPFSWIECGSRDPAGATEVMGTLMGDINWSGTVHVRGDVYVYTAKLTIAPGTRVLMDVDSNLYIGWNSNVVTLVADGTPAAPITFCGTRGDRGFWESVQIGRNVTSDSVLRNVLFADGSGAEVALELEADVLIDNVQVRNAENDGVHAADFKAGSRALSVQGAGKAPVVLTTDTAMTNFPLGGAFIENVDNTVHIRFTTIDDDTVVHNVGIPYVQEQDLYHYGKKLTFEAGVEYRFVPDAALFVGWNSAAGELLANGTLAAPIVFRGTQEAPGSWQGISIGRAIATTSKLTHVQIRHAGGASTAALEVSSAILLDHVSLSDNVIGMVLEAQGLAAGSSNLTITRTGGRPLTVHPNAVGTLPLGGTFTGNQIDQVAVETGTLTNSVTFQKIGVPYFLASGTMYTTGPMLTFAPGTEFVMGADTSWQIGWNGAAVTLVANGTPAEPIRFRGVDTVRGYWGGIALGRGVTSSSVLNQLTIENAGGGGGGALELNTALPVTNSRFIASGGYGIVRPTVAATIDYAATNTFTDMALGNIGDQ